MNQRRVIFLAIALIAVAAGCVGGTTGSTVAFDQNAGVRIDQFSSDVDQLYDNEPITLTLKVQNVGSKTMNSDSMLWIYGPQVSNTLSNDVWSVNVASLPSGASLTNGYISKTLSTTSFTPPNVDKGIPGSVDVSDITFTSPKVPENMQRSDEFFARVCYPYQTQALSRLVATTRNQLRTQPVQKTDAITRASAGPIQIRLLSGENLVADRLQAGNVPLVFELTDVGGGFATTRDTECVNRNPDVDVKQLNKINFTVTVDGIATDCNGKTVTMSRGTNQAQPGTTSVSCRLTTNLGATPAPKTEFTVTATANYNYFLTKSASVTVLNENL